MTTHKLKPNILAAGGCWAQEHAHNKRNAAQQAMLIMGVVMAVFIFASAALATPSTTYWTPCTIDIQPAGTTHLGVDDYSSTRSKAAGDQFPTDFGLTFGANLTSRIAVEYGVDVLSPGANPLYFNAKLGFRENVIAKGAPALQLGFLNFGTKDKITNQNVVYLTTGHSLPNGRTRIAASCYIGNGDVLVSSDGSKENMGYMVAFDHAIIPGKIVLAGDYASGKNAIGGGGVGVYYYFTKDISLLGGPVWFNDTALNGPAKLTLQLDVNF